MHAPFFAKACVCAPAYLCWKQTHGHFVQIGSTDPSWFDRHGKEIPRDELMHGDYQQYRVCDEFGMVPELSHALSMLNARYSDCGYTIIMLAGDEWGNQTMEEVAREYFLAHPDCQFVSVHEHAGWYLGFRRDGSIWSTANDMARLSNRYPLPDRGCEGEVRRTS